MKNLYWFTIAAAFIHASLGLHAGAANADWPRPSFLKNSPLEAAAAEDGEIISKAIIVAGGGDYPGNSLWEATQMLSNFAFRALATRCYDKEAIYYLSDDINVDVDGNGLFDDVDAQAAVNNLQYAINNWAADADELLIYMTGHGGNAVFRMNETEVLFAHDLDDWLDALQEIIPGRVIVVYDVCQSGSFIPVTSPPPGKERIVIAGAAQDESAFFLSGGTISFSYFFWTRILNGDGLHDAYVYASDSISLALSIQNPQIEANGNGIGNEKEDMLAAEPTTIGRDDCQTNCEPIDTGAKAIIVAGGGSFIGNTLWNATSKIADLSYKTLMHRGYSKEAIYYLSDDVGIDADGNGLMDDVDDYATLSNLQHAITTWAADAEELLIFITDHGGNGMFRMNETELLFAHDLDDWLDALQETNPGRVTVVYDACQSGSFIPAMLPPAGRARILATGSAADECAFFINDGALSFSFLFWSHIMDGEGFYNAFINARNSMALIGAQTAQLDANGNGIPNEKEDKEIARPIYIGQNACGVDDRPRIGEASPTQTLDLTKGEESALIYARGILSRSEIDRVWAEIYVPGKSPEDPPVIMDLDPMGDGRYASVYGQFDATGTYSILIYASNENGLVSAERTTRVIVVAPPPPGNEMKAIIVAGGGDYKGHTNWEYFKTLSTRAYQTLMSQGYRKDTIYFLSPQTDFDYDGDGVADDVDADATVSNLHWAITDWARDAGGLLVYMVDHGFVNRFMMNETEHLHALDLDAWLDDAQGVIPGSVVVVYDACYAGSFIPNLLPPPGKTRAVVTSSAADETAMFPTRGVISFSNIFWGELSRGITFYQSYVAAKNGMALSWSQNARIEANGNGIPNEDEDKTVVRQIKITTETSYPIVPPYIGGVSGPRLLDGEATALIVAEEVFKGEEIQSVLALITPPGWDSQSAGGPVTDLRTLALNNVGDKRYERVHDGFTLPGVYEITIYALDKNGLTSNLRRTTVTVVDADSDDDGVPNKQEDVNGNGELDPGETDPRNADTDGDGLPDGVELGWTADDVGDHTDPALFQPDLDPSTTTDPRSPDTDGDGFPDGVEDVNHNGIVDAGEGDPGQACAYSAVKIEGSATRYGVDIQGAYDIAEGGDVIEAHGVAFGPLTLDREVSVTLKGGWNCDFSESAAPTLIDGPVVIEKGAVIIENLVIR